jgi:hypothetical protein
VAYYTASGHLQLTYFAPIEDTTPFHAEAEALKLTILSWSSPYFQKSTKIFTDCKYLVKFLQTEKNEDLPCWRGAGATYGCLERVRSERAKEVELEVAYVNRMETGVAYELANMVRCRCIGLIGLPSAMYMQIWGLAHHWYMATNFKPP